MKIKNRIKDLGHMFYECENLKNIDELKYLNTKYCNNINVCSVDVHHYQILKDQKNGMYQMELIFMYAQWMFIIISNLKIRKFEYI